MSNPMRVLRIAASAVMCISIVGLGVPAHAAANDGLARFYAQRIAWQSCGEQLQCGSVLVPLDYRKPAGETLSIAVNRRLSAGENAPSLVFNPGGPGGSGVQFIASASSVKLLLNPSTPSVQGTYNWVGFDPRGVGSSLPLQCMTQAQLDAKTGDNPITSAQQQAVAKADEAFGANCLRVGRGLISNIGTQMVARDLDIIRAALGSPKLDYYGVSYGTYIGQVYASLFPNRVGRMVLDSIESATATEVDIAKAQAKSFQANFDHWAQQCPTRTKTCPAPAGMPGDQIGAWATGLMNALAASPIPVGTSRPFSQGDALGVASDAITQGGLTGPVLLDALIAAIAKQDAKGLAQVQPLAIGTPNLWSSNAAVMCFDRPMDGTLADTVANAKAWQKTWPTFGAYYAWAIQACNTWPVRHGQPMPVVEQTTKAPVLLISSLHDPNTPHAWAVKTAEQFPNNALLTWVGYGHGSGDRLNLCVNDTAAAYLVNGTLPQTGAMCPEFDLPKKS